MSDGMERLATGEYARAVESKEGSGMSDDLRIFSHPNTSGGWSCPICHTTADRPVVLVPFRETDDPNILECKQVHHACYQLVMEMNEAEEDRG